MKLPSKREARLLWKQSGNSSPHRPRKLKNIFITGRINARYTAPEAKGEG